MFPLKKGAVHKVLYFDGSGFTSNQLWNWIGGANRCQIKMPSYYRYKPFYKNWESMPTYVLFFLIVRWWYWVSKSKPVPMKAIS
jgi:hypothetical protein